MRTLNYSIDEKCFFFSQLNVIGINTFVFSPYWQFKTTAIEDDMLELFCNVAVALFQ